MLAYRYRNNDDTTKNTLKWWYLSSREQSSCAVVQALNSESVLKRKRARRTRARALPLRAFAYRWLTGCVCISARTNGLAYARYIVDRRERAREKERKRERKREEEPPRSIFHRLAFNPGRGRHLVSFRPFNTAGKRSARNSFAVAPRHRRERASECINSFRVTTLRTVPLSRTVSRTT